MASSCLGFHSISHAGVLLSTPSFVISLPLAFHSHLVSPRAFSSCRYTHVRDQCCLLSKDYILPKSECSLTEFYLIKPHILNVCGYQVSDEDPIGRILSLTFCS